MARPGVTICGQRFILPNNLKPTKGKRNENDEKIYSVVIDSLGRYKESEMIDRPTYGAISVQYSIRVIRWTPGLLPEKTGEIIYYVSGPKRKAVLSWMDDIGGTFHVHRDYIMVCGEKIKEGILKRAVSSAGSVLWLRLIADPALGEKKVKDYIGLSKIKV